MSNEITGVQVDAVLATVKSLSDESHVQLSILAHALILGCRLCNVPKENAIQVFTDLVEIDWEKPLPETIN